MLLKTDVNAQRKQPMLGLVEKHTGDKAGRLAEGKFQLLFEGCRLFPQLLMAGSRLQAGNPEGTVPKVG